MKNFFKSIKLIIIFNYNFLFICHVLLTIFIIGNGKEIHYINQLYNHDFEISIKINQAGEQTFINKLDGIKEIYVNNKNITKDQKQNKIYLNESNNEIKIIFESREYHYLGSLFQNCPSINEIDLSNFNSSTVDDMQNMFNGCINLTSIKFFNFDTNKVTNMQQMFINCEKLISLDLSNFNLSNVNDMQNMFNGCKNLTFVTFSNIKADKVITMQQMFINCEKLTSLDLSNFNLSNVNDMQNMFNGCKSLTFVNFPTSRLIKLQTPIKCL
jgi:surface protein